MHNTKSIIALLNEIKPNDWSSFFSGWVTNGPYITYKLTDFQDNDLDTLMDVEEHFLGTNPQKQDSDGDYVSDGYEVEIGSNPISPNMHPDLSEPVLDGVKEPVKIDWKLLSKTNDASGDGKKGTDLKSLEIFRIKNQLYIRADYFNAPQNRPLIHTIHLRDQERGRNYWIQTYDARNALWIAEFEDGTPFEKWEKSNSPIESLKKGYGEIYELQLDTTIFRLGNRVSINYIVGGYENNKQVWNVDESGENIFYLSQTEIRIDGDCSDIFEFAKSGISIRDPSGDSKSDSNIYDINSFAISRLDDILYVTGEFSGKAEQVEWHPVTLHVYFPDEQQNLWIQFWSKHNPGVKSFKNGTPFKDWNSLTIEKALLLKAYAERQKDLELQLPIQFLKSLIPEVKDARHVRIKIITGGLQNKISNWSVDESDWLELSRELLQ